MPLGSLSRREAAGVLAYVDALRRELGDLVLDAFVFGSKARGDSHAASDVDVLVLLQHPTPAELSLARGLAFDIWLSHRVFLSVRAMSQEQWEALGAVQSLFYRNALHDAVPLLAR